MRIPRSNQLRPLRCISQKRISSLTTPTPRSESDGIGKKKVNVKINGAGEGTLKFRFFNNERGINEKFNKKLLWKHFHYKVFKRSEIIRNIFLYVIIDRTKGMSTK